MNTLNTSGRETLKEFHKRMKEQPKKIRLFTDPCYGGVGDVDDHAAILMCSYYLNQRSNNIQSLEIVISSTDQSERKNYLKKLEFFEHLVGTLLDNRTYEIIRLEDFADNLRDRKDVEGNFGANAFNVLNIWNAPINKTKVLEYFGRSKVLYLIQGYNFANDANLKETKKYLKCDNNRILSHLNLTTEDKLPGISSQASNKTFLYSDILAFQEDNILIRDLKRLFYLKTIGQAVCVAKFVLEKFSSGFFAPDAENMVDYDKDQRKNEDNHQRTKELIFGTGIENKEYWGGGKGNNVKPFFFALSSMSNPVKTMEDILSNTILTGEETQNASLDDEEITIKGTSAGSVILKLDTREIFPETLNISEPSKRGFRFIVLSLCWVFGTNNMVNFFDTQQVEGNTYNIVGLKAFSLSEPMESHIEVLNNQIFRVLEDSKPSDTDAATIDKKKFLEGILISTPPLWDAISVIKYLKYPDSDPTDEDYKTEINDALQLVSVKGKRLFEKEYQKHKRLCCAEQEHVYNGVKYSDMSSCSVPSKYGVKILTEDCPQGGRGRKRTNKRIRKNKKRSLRKMKGGSKKANQKKLKPRKSRKA